MASAGDRYEERTGNIWSYAHRGDMTGLKAAVVRGVDVDMANTVGWTACHAAAAGGQTKALRYLIQKMGADIAITDKGGNLAIHHAAKNGHAQALRTLQDFGADITKVRLSQAKGKAVRDLVLESYRKAGTKDLDAGEELDDGEVVGYARRQSKSTAFWGPRRTPISCKIKKKIIKDKRKNRKVKLADDSHQDNTEQECSDSIVTEDIIKNDEKGQQGEEQESSYLETVRQVKRNKKQKRRQLQLSRSNTKHEDERDEEHKADTSSSRRLCKIESVQINTNISNRLKVYENSNSECDIDDGDCGDGDKQSFSIKGQFAALALIGDDSDSE